MVGCSYLIYTYIFNGLHQHLLVGGRGVGSGIFYVGLGGPSVGCCGMILLAGLEAWEGGVYLREVIYAWVGWC